MNDAMTLMRPDLTLSEILLYSLLSFLLVLLFTPWFVSFLRKNKVGKQLRVQTVDGQEPTIFRTYHKSKFGTPTMGGILIWSAIIATVGLSRLLSFSGLVEHSLLQRGQVYLPLFVLLCLGILGAVDDYLNIIGSDAQRVRALVKPVKHFLPPLFLTLIIVTLYIAEIYPSSIGPAFFTAEFGILTMALSILFLCSLACMFTARWDDALYRLLLRQGKNRGMAVIPKILSLLIISLYGALWFYARLDYSSVTVPFMGVWELGVWYVPLFMFVMVGTANAVNFTDGLDGLAGGLLVIAFGSFGVLAYLQGLFVLAAFCAVCMGAIAAFLWHNVPPALFFMGDTGSLALGGMLAVIAMMIDQMLVLPLVGFVFVVEVLSVVIQLTSKKVRGGKKVFLAAPIHHHFEALGWGESKVTMRLWIVGAFLAVLGIVVGVIGV